MRRLLLLLALLSPSFAQADTLIFLTRHGEKVADGGKDPELTAQGQSRARALATMLGKAGIQAVHSTDTRRTRQTAQPLAAVLGLPVQLYSAANHAELVRRLRAAGGTAFVVGHSDTLADLVSQLGGAPGAAIGDFEYDRLYQLIVGDDGKVRTVMLTSTAP